MPLLYTWKEKVEADDFREELSLVSDDTEKVYVYLQIRRYTLVLSDDRLMPFNTNRRALVVRARHFSPFPRYAVSILREKAERKGLTRSSKFNRIAPNVSRMLNKHAQTIGSIISGKGTRVF